MKNLHLPVWLTRASVGVLAAGLASGAGWAVRADAAGVASITFASPSSDGATITTSPVDLSGQVSQQDAVIDSVDISVHWTDTVNRPPASHPAQQTALNPNAGASTYQWAYTPDLGSNGQYSVTVTAVTHPSAGGSRTQSTATETFVQDAPPARPVGLSDSVDASHNTVTLTWVANTEQDLIGYEILRGGPTASDPYKLIYGVQSPTTNYTDSEVAKEPAGTYRYQIAAVRQSGSGTKADVSGPSAPAYATFSPPPGSTPTTVAGGGTATGGTAPGSTGTTTPATTGGTAPPAGGTGTGGTGGSATSPPPRSGIVLPTVGSGLGGYQSLLGAAQTATATTEPPDTGYNPKLPYQAQTGAKPLALPGDLGPSSLQSGSGNGTSRTVEFVAGALLLAVLALFGLVLRRAADQVPPLEAVSPDTAWTGEADGSSLLLTIFSTAASEPSPSEPAELEPLEPIPELVGATAT